MCIDRNPFSLLPGLSGCRGAGLRDLLRDEEGTTAIEYALMASLIAAVAVVGITALGGSVRALWDDTAAKVGAAL